MKWSLIFVCLLAFAASLPLASTRGTQLISFEITDQFDRLHTEAELLGAVVVMLVSDQRGSQYSDEWERGIRGSFPATEHPQGVRVVSIANLHNVPFFIRRFVKSKFPKDEQVPIWLDWHGQIAKAYGFEENYCNVFTFDESGTLVHRMAATGVDPETLQDLVQKLRGLLSELKSVSDRKQ